MFSCAEQVQIQKCKTYADKILKTTGVQIIMLKHPTKHKKRIPIKPIYRINVHKNMMVVVDQNMTVGKDLKAVTHKDMILVTGKIDVCCRDRYDRQI